MNDNNINSSGSRDHSFHTQPRVRTTHIQEEIRGHLRVLRQRNYRRAQSTIFRNMKSAIIRTPKYYHLMFQKIIWHHRVKEFLRAALSHLQFCKEN